MASVHTYPANLSANPDILESALQSNVWTVNPVRWRSKIVSSLLPNNKPIWRHNFPSSWTHFKSCSLYARKFSRVNCTLKLCETVGWHFQASVGVWWTNRTPKTVETTGKTTPSPTNDDRVYLYEAGGKKVRRIPSNKPWVLEWVRIPSYACRRGNFWIRKEKVADSKISGYVWTGPALSYIVKLPDEGCASHTKRVGDKKIFTTQEVRKSAVHCFILLKIFLKIQECRKLFWYFYPKFRAQRLSQNLTDRATFSRQNQANQSNAWIQPPLLPPSTGTNFKFIKT